MISRLLEWNRRLDAWQKRGGTPRWMVYNWIRITPRIFPAIGLWILSLYLIAMYLPNPNEWLALLGTFAILVFSMNAADNVLSHFQRRDED